MPRAKTSSSLAGKKRVRFQLEAEKGSEVFIAGSFNDWNPANSKLAYRDGVFCRTLLLPKGRYEYKFVVNGVWCVDPACSEWMPNGMGSLNSVVVV
jgi:1,4-alpha-glucan branching enzyme